MSDLRSKARGSVPYPQRSDVQAACSAKRATRTGLSHRSTHEPTETQTIVTGFREGARHLLDPCPKCAAPCIFSSDFSMGSQDEAAILACLLAFSPAECLRLLDRVEAYQEAGEGVLAAFDAGAFVRDIRGDGDPASGIKLFPHLRWLAKLTQLVRPEPAPRPEPGETPHA